MFRSYSIISHWFLKMRCLLKQISQRMKLQLGRLIAQSSWRLIWRSEYKTRRSNLMKFSWRISTFTINRTTGSPSTFSGECCSSFSSSSSYPTVWCWNSSLSCQSFRSWTQWCNSIIKIAKLRSVECTWKYWYNRKLLIHSTVTFTKKQSS